MIRFVYVFANVYVIRYQNVYVGSYVVFGFHFFELCRIQYLRQVRLSNERFHIAVTKNYYRNLFLMGLIIFVSLIEIHTLQYAVFIGVLFMQMYKLKMDKKDKI